MSLFDTGPWDNAKVKGAHVFSSERKLLYGNEHDKAEHLAEHQDGSAYGQAERHKLHDFWRKNALKMLAEQVKRNGKEAMLYKVAARKGPQQEVWPGDLGKHHLLIEEMLQLGVVTLHQDDNAVTYAKVHSAPLHRAIDKFNAAEAAQRQQQQQQQQAAAAASSALAARPHPFAASDTFAGARTGCVFKMGEMGVGYYRDGPDGEAEGSGVAAPALPAGWVSGTTPEGYTYYWHTLTGTSSWELPTGPPPVNRHVALAPHVATTLAAANSAAVRKIEDDSGAVIRLDLHGSSAHVRGSEGEVARACQLLERKAGAIAFAAAHNAAQQPPPSRAAAMAAAPPPVAGGKRKGEYDFTGVAGFVAEADAARAALRQRPLEGSGALASLAQYGDDDDDDE